MWHSWQGQGQGSGGDREEVLEGLSPLEFQAKAKNHREPADPGPSSAAQLLPALGPVAEGSCLGWRTAGRDRPCSQFHLRTPATCPEAPTSRKEESSNPAAVTTEAQTQPGFFLLGGISRRHTHGDRCYVVKPQASEHWRRTALAPS